MRVAPQRGAAAFMLMPGPVSAAILPPALLITATAGLCVVLALWWIRERRELARTQMVRRLTQLSEEVVLISSPRDTRARCAEAFAAAFGTTRVRLYTYNRATSHLDRVPDASEPEPLAINPDAPSGCVPTGAAYVFRNQKILSVADTHRSPFFRSGAGVPRSITFVPMLANTESMGVLELSDATRVRFFSEEERASIQHVANQTAAALKLREGPYRRLNPAAGELRAPIEKILLAIEALLARQDDAGADLRMLAEEARRAQEIASRLFPASAVSAESGPIDLNGLVASLIRSRGGAWKESDIRLETRLARVPLYTSEPGGELEGLVTKMLAHAAEGVLDTTEKIITVTTGTSGGRARVQIAFPCAGGRASAGPEPPAARWRTLWPTPVECHLELDVPLYLPAPAPETPPGTVRKARTTLVVEPDDRFQGTLLQEFSARGYRVVPVASAEEGLDLAQRLRFDVVVCSSRLPGLNWIEFFERVRELTGAFVLLSSGPDTERGPRFEQGEGFVLHRPNYATEIDALLSEIEAAQGSQTALHRGA